MAGRPATHTAGPESAQGPRGRTVASCMLKRQSAGPAVAAPRLEWAPGDQRWVLGEASQGLLSRFPSDPSLSSSLVRLRSWPPQPPHLCAH